MPAILHALVDGVAVAHTAGIVHCDLHPFNIMLDYTRTNQPQIGIIDWGMLIQMPTKHASLNFESNANTDLAALVEVQEIYDHNCADAFTKSSDIYALKFIFEMLIDFWTAVVKIHMADSLFVHPEDERIKLIF